MGNSIKSKVLKNQMVQTLSDLPQGNPNGGQRGNPMAIPTNFSQDPKQQPFFFYFYGAISLAIYVLSFVIPMVLSLTLHQPEASLFHLMLWEPFTCLYANLNLFSLLISWFLLWQLLLQKDQQSGTAATFLIINYYSIFTQVLLMLLYLPIRLGLGPVAALYSAGIWPVYICILTRDCMAIPEEYSQFCCFPCPIKNKYYPFILCLFFSILGGARMDMWVGLSAGLVMENFAWIDSKMTPSITCIKRVEEWLKRIATIGKIVTFEEAAGMQVAAPTTSTNNTAVNNNANPFAGRGVTLGTEPTVTGNMGFSSQQQVFDHLQKTNTDNIQKEKAREAALKRDRENRDKADAIADAKKVSQDEELGKKQKDIPVEALEEMGTTELNVMEAGDIEIDLGAGNNFDEPKDGKKLGRKNSDEDAKVNHSNDD